MFPIFYFLKCFDLYQNVGKNANVTVYFNKTFFFEIINDILEVLKIAQIKSKIVLEHSWTTVFIVAIILKGRIEKLQNQC